MHGRLLGSGALHPVNRPCACTLELNNVLDTTHDLGLEVCVAGSNSKSRALSKGSKESG